MNTIIGTIRMVIADAPDHMAADLQELRDEYRDLARRLTAGTVKDPEKEIASLEEWLEESMTEAILS